jgi:hypothetical protein
VLIAPEEMLARALNGNPHLQQFRIVFLAGVRPDILSWLDRSSKELIMRRAFTSAQLLGLALFPCPQPGQDSKKFDGR